MDKFVIRKAISKNKRTLLDESAGGSDTGRNVENLTRKKRKIEKDDLLQEQTYTWKRISAENLSCDYTSLFNKAEADDIFLQLEKAIVYFTGDLSKVQVYGKWHNVPRKQVTFGDDGLSYTFSGITLSPKPWIPVLNLIRERVQLATGYTFNFVLINRYKDGNDHMGDHRDDEKELVPQSPIASVSFGACRDFIFRHRDSRGKNAVRKMEPVKLELEHGSLLMMNFPTNVYWYHSLPVRRKVLAPRVNLTFRKIKPQNQR
ncbi:DNA oxidative demethylase ALKBH2 isoform X2 [Hyla sarda]|uniref:DNA oxidative demethylase ALKBH2 isoform X2 n=1 Tax=Hyla sarda TaxID=327740 RepID=UPI0024C3C66F|nr:DNA oxidative demethylase ALKBH2 isoform X2 [Hyla sarda]XP_056384786.1 DNA oxidative demethylase ALKBH2 isoform X2 [Hyla sarda]XP_056384787.1 DNA oxidative demethylase ALKBH2 isoform X2 [Hyla sarda]XP_056384788.1 DNA oxidative demethylase ALKBH2 isoform X2 [Hyla sarda]XP_056384789.1 DNA oxidative demethylase ALKBH2 isoform X2 [Hyla sarda]XP_056384790.1 DNA oxidative demethylase ALKBH2 isoform X2 [Hyla sarda]XP_056384791.1 DNA oxidative demethylase ALKBH2 isoform X2 [Hyla sarda]XP_05638479